MLLLPLFLALLLHDVVPDVHGVLVILRKDVERSAGKRQDLGVFLDEKLANFLAEIGLRSLVGFIYDDEIPVHLEHATVLVVPSVHHLRTAQILYGCEIDETRTGFIEAGKLLVVLRFDLSAEFVVGNERILTVKIVPVRC